jgi:2-dehydro-3-deoxygluconokinase
MAKIVTMGEIMLRLSPEGNYRFIQTDKFNIIPGGGEANVAISCANYGHECYFVSKLPKHEIGQIAVNAMRKYGVNTDHIARGGERIGLYYAETGASMRASKVIYDRANSAIAEAKPEDFDFDRVESLSIECRQKLKKYAPRTIAQASRISGISPADVSVLLVYFGR